MLTGFAEEIWRYKYKYSEDLSWSDTCRRIAKAIASVEKDGERDVWENVFYNYMYSQVLIPGGRITNGAGTKHNYLLNCAVLGIEDSIDAIYDTVKRAAVLSKCNYGVGYNFSTLRPKDDTLSMGGNSSGPVSFMKVFDASGSVIQTGGARRAAQIGVLNIDHPDIEEFIDAKRTEGVLSQFNLSVGITEAFMDAVKSDSDWDLRFKGKVYRTVKAKALWDKLCESAWSNNDPGILFLDEINKWNNAHYLYRLDATNPCGELPLPANGVCCLGNINLTKFIKDPFGYACMTGQDCFANFDKEGYIQALRAGVRFLDNVLDVSDYPYQDIADRVKSDRRIGLNPIAGLGSTLAMLRVPYDSPLAIDFVDTLCELAMEVTYLASANLAIDKGSFPNYQEEPFMSSMFVDTKLPNYVKEEIRACGIRNVALLTVPPVGTGSLIAGNISNGLEPIFSLEYNRKLRLADGSFKEEAVEDYAWGLYKKKMVNQGFPLIGAETPDYFKTSRQISPKDHVKMQATIQKWIDGSLSKTCNMPADYTLDQYKELLEFAINSGCKGFTTFREGTREGVLTEKTEKANNEPVEVKKDLPKRPRILDGRTYQIKDNTDRRTYCTINYVQEGSSKKPWEVFLFSKSEHHEWYAAMGVLISAIMRRVGNVDFLIKDLKEISGDHSYFTQEYGRMGSKPAHIAHIIEEYTRELNGTEVEIEYMSCPKCKEKSYIKEGGCSKCLNCGHSTCG